MMLKLKPRTGVAPALLCLLALLLLVPSFAWAGGKTELMSAAAVEENRGFALQEPQDWVDPQTPEIEPGMESDTITTGWQQIPPWLQIILSVGIALLIYYIILAIIRSRQKKEEVIVTYKTGTADSGQPMEQSPGPVASPQQPQAPPEYRFPQPDRPEGQSRTPSSRKKSSWGLIVAIIVIINVIRQCIQSN